MPCDTRIPAGMTEEQRLDEIQDSIARLEQDLESGNTTVTISPEGAIAFTGGWNDRRSVSDVCAYRKLAVDGSFALREAVARAEALAGRSIDEQQIAAGTHSHDGGKTWHPGH